VCSVRYHRADADCGPFVARGVEGFRRGTLSTPHHALPQLSVSLPGRRASTTTLHSRNTHVCVSDSAEVDDDGIRSLDTSSVAWPPCGSSASHRSCLTASHKSPCSSHSSRAADRSGYPSRANAIVPGWHNGNSSRALMGSEADVADRQRHFVSFPGRLIRERVSFV
jgi:hypothetical protein